MKKMKCILLLMIMMLLLTACGGNEEEVQEEVSQEVEQDAEESSQEAEDFSSEPVKLFGEFETQTLEGETITEEIFTNADLTMVNIWGTFCGPCIAEMPDLGEISREYKDKGFQIVGMLCDVMDSGDETALEIVDETKADYTHVIASDDLTINVLQYVSSVPTTVFVDKEGYVVGEIYSGSRDKTAWELIINQYLVEIQ